jgi:two-component system sensor histidine kinase HydH
MRILRLKKMYFPALSIVAVVLLLLVLIGISTYRNLDREKKLALAFLHREGIALVLSLEAGARAGMMMPMWNEDAVGNLIQEIGRNEDIAYIYLLDRAGEVVHHSGRPPEGGLAPWNPKLASRDQLVSRIRKQADGSQVYELAKLFEPLAGPAEVTGHSGMMMQMMVPHSHRDATIVLGLKMTEFEKARAADLQHALIMAAILLVLGTGALYFIFVIQNYYLVDTTLKQTQDYTAQVLASMANGLLSVDREGRIVSYNRLALELLGLEEPLLSGTNLKEVIDFQASGIHDTLSLCRPVLEREIHHSKQSGEPVPLALSVTPILGREGECSGAVIVLRDLTEIKKLEEEVRRAEKLAAVGKLAAGVAHEIRNPLSSIRGFARFLRDALAERPQERECAEIMAKEVDRINKVVTDLLTFARPMEAELAPTDVAELMEHTLRLVEEDARGRRVEILKGFSPDLPPVALDANQMTQALLNLLLNALEVSQAGGKIEAGTAMAGSASRLLVWVEDDGPGIPAENMGKIFDPFFTTRESGTGLGLAMVHKIVENHKGDIRVESPVPGKSRGSRFTISIPVTTDKPRSVEGSAGA